MPLLTNLYRGSLALLNDLYELTMAYGYWKLGRTGEQAVFSLHFRHNPFRGGYTVACGLEAAIEFIQALRYSDDDLAYLATLRGGDGQPLFERGFLDYLRALEFTCDIDAIPEGTVVFPHEPLVRVSGPILQAQLLETPLLNLINFPTLIATKAARVRFAARGNEVIEFGLRRAQGIDGGITATRAAYVGGCTGTSSVIAGKLLGIPVKGTHAHSWVMSFDSEPEAFDAYARAMPNNVIFLVDTYDTLDGVAHAIEAGKKLRAAGHELAGIRLDSGDLAYLSIEARKMLDAAGFAGTKILASNDLDEHIIESLKSQGATIAVWGVGTHLVTAYDQPALGGVYKLTALRHSPSAPWRYTIKLSEQTAKSSTPGITQVRRFYDGPRRDRNTHAAGEHSFIGDAIYDDPTPGAGLQGDVEIVHPEDPMRNKIIPAGTPGEDLLVPVFRAGKFVYAPPPLAAIQKRTRSQLASLHGTIRRLLNPHPYPAGLERRLHELKARMVADARRPDQAPSTI